MTAPTGRDLGPLGAFSLGIGGIVGGGVFATIGLAVVAAHGAAHLSFLVGGLLALLTAYAYVRLTLAFPGQGGTVTFVAEAFGGGLLAAGLNTLLVFSYVMVMAVYAITLANYAAHFLPPALDRTWQPLLAPGAILVLALVNLVGPRLVERSEGLLNVCKLAILVAFIVAGLASPALTLDRLGPAQWVGPVDIVAGGMVVFLSYEGFELIANASDRIRTPGRSLPLAYYGSVGAAILLYVLMVVVTVGHLSFAAIADTQAYALSAAAQTFMGGTGFGLLAAGAVLAAASAINADLFGAAKLPVILAQAGEAPRSLGRAVWGRYPAALALVAVLAVLITRAGDLRAISAASSAGFLLVFAMVNVANVRLAARTGSRRWISALAAVACLAALATMLVQIARQTGGRDELRLIVGLALLPFVYQAVFRLVPRAWHAGRAADRPRHGLVHRALATAATVIAVYLLLAYVALPWAWWLAERGRHPALEGLPKVTTNADGIPGDPINVGLVGTREELIRAMLAAGWRPADPITLRSSVEIAASVVLDRPDLDAPVSPLYLFGRKQDLAFEQEVGRSADRRHHVRWWLTGQSEQGRPFWLGDASFDVGSGVSHLTGQITHHIDPDVDAMRDGLMADLARAGMLSDQFQLPGLGPTVDGRNAGGDRYFTDGMIDVGVLKLVGP